jgi:hypothetical protein
MPLLPLDCLKIPQASIFVSEYFATLKMHLDVFMNIRNTYQISPLLSFTLSCKTLLDLDSFAFQDNIMHLA